MSLQKYYVNHHLIESLLIWVKSGEIAFPKIPRPFDLSKVRDLIDSLLPGIPGELSSDIFRSGHR